MTDAIEKLAELVVGELFMPVGDARDVSGLILAAIQAAPFDYLEFKPLVWDKLSETTYRVDALMFGNIRIENYGFGWEVLWSVPGFCDTLVKGDFTTLELAQAAAQTHHDNRLKECLR